MIWNKGFTAIVYCDGCQGQLSEGPYPLDAEDSLPFGCIIVSGEGEVPNEHYCAQCYVNQLIPKEANNETV